MPNPQNLVSFSKGFDPRRNLKGAPKSAKRILSDNGYRSDEVNRCIMVMIAMTIPEIIEVYQNPKSRLLERTIANACLHSLKKGSLYSVLSLLDRAIGKPTETSEVSMIAQITSVAPQVINSPIKLANDETTIED